MKVPDLFVSFSCSGRAHLPRLGLSSPFVVEDSKHPKLRTAMDVTYHEKQNPRSNQGDYIGVLSTGSGRPVLWAV